MKNLLAARLTWPVVALAALLLLNFVLQPNFFSIRVQDGHLYGSLIDIVRNGAPTVLVALGMTLVIATRGLDLSVGSIVAIAGAVACSILASSGSEANVPVVIVAVAAALAAALVLGAWNGFLVAVVGIPPIVATLILMTAGRGLALLITQGQIVTVSSAAYRVIGAGFALGLPVSILIAAVIYAAAALLTRKTALGMLIDAVGVNPIASRIAGVPVKGINWSVYAFSGLCAGVAGLMISSNVTAADSNSAGLWIELDAILAVVIGGTPVGGGRFSLSGTLVGAFIIQTLTATAYTAGIAPGVMLVLKAIVVAAVCVMQAPRVRSRAQRRVPSRPRAGVRS
ncbi:ABC transporter permease [Humibacter albus]|uniref:ABC transporter permease n=1 Tax=Humibacter albus TaxID=427754 RepID=UPI0003B47DDF|nr:ABC transporter permease [Humibacter albus]